MEKLKEEHYKLIIQIFENQPIRGTFKKLVGSSEDGELKRMKEVIAYCKEQIEED